MNSGSPPDIVEGVHQPIVIFVHVYHLDVWNEVVEWIELTVKRPFHLVLTTPHAPALLRVPDGPFLRSKRTIVTPNGGRDIRPFLQALCVPLDYEIGLKLHTKRSTHRLEGGDWGRMLVRSLLPDSETIDRTVERMSRDPRFAMVVPDGMLVSVGHWMGANRGPMLRAANRLGLQGRTVWRPTSVFGAGSMFWFRHEALEILERSDLDDLFEPESGQVDGTMAHALERLFAPIAEFSTGGVITTMQGAAVSQECLPIEQLRAQSRQMADQSTVYLRRPPRYVRWVLRIPGLRALYAALPSRWRQWIRNRLRR